MSDRLETLAAILAEMRGNEFDDPHLDADGIVGARRLARDWADRIEAAAERDRNAHINDIHDALYLATGIPGNAAALRDLLEKIRHEYGWGRISCRTCVSSEADVERVSDLFEKQIDAALAAPARNCDVSRDTKKTIDRCLADLDVESCSASFEAGVCAAIGWMLAAPAKGGAE